MSDGEIPAQTNLGQETGDNNNNNNSSNNNNNNNNNTNRNINRNRDKANLSNPIGYDGESKVWVLFWVFATKSSTKNFLSVSLLTRHITT